MASDAIYLVDYEELCADPIGVSKRLVNWLGLEWDGRIEDFLKASIDATSDATGYHDLKRNPQIAASKWRKEMSQDEINRILEICGPSAALALYADEDTQNVSRPNVVG